MKAHIAKTLDPILVFLIFVLYFLTVKLVVPNIIYLVISILLALYFFPIKLFVKHWKDDAPSNLRTIYFFSFLLIAILISLSTVLVYFDDSKIFHNITLVISIINILLAYIYFILKYPNYLFVLHFSISFLGAAVIFI